MADDTNSKLGYTKKVKEYTNIINYESFYVHRHFFWEFFVIIKGTTKHYLNDKESSLRRGDLVLIRPSNDYHYFRDSSVPDYEHRDLYANTTMFKTVCDLMNPNLYSCLWYQQELMAISLNESELEYYKNMLDALYADQSQRDDKSVMCSYIPLLTSFISLFARKYFINIGDDERQFRRFISTINTQKYICGTLDDIVAISNYSHGYLCRLFKSKMGEPLKTYHVKLKINYAMDLLRTSNKSILEISSLLGYDSLSNFIYVFKSYVGTSPAKYRKSMKNKIED